MTQFRRIRLPAPTGTARTGRVATGLNPAISIEVELGIGCTITSHNNRTVTVQCR